ncbi:MAG TPA: hypothetical protein PK513_06755 [Alphaproteobacteria bacterium]|nr:hypothetical protein [Alphaproteobacteria bacterium]USO05810.1 MAG: hypothetical protein H6859_00990 [Rhodospirillales bacterium]HOO82184.1 hypothetical protein [Alphaproteobacteria bacterium]
MSAYTNKAGSRVRGAFNAKSIKHNTPLSVYISPKINKSTSDDTTERRKQYQVSFAAAITRIRLRLNELGIRENTTANTPSHIAVFVNKSQLQKLADHPDIQKFKMNPTDEGHVEGRTINLI